MTVRNMERNGFKMVWLSTSYPNFSFNIVKNEQVVFRGATLHEHEAVVCFNEFVDENI